MQTDTKDALAASAYLATSLNNHFRSASNILDAYKGREEELLQTAKDLDFTQATHGACIATLALMTPLALYDIVDTTRSKDQEQIEPLILGLAFVSAVILRTSAKALNSIHNHVSNIVGEWETRPAP